ncbi:hypothetical protein B0H16DRAFT_1235884, partial [Mycena metata]
SPPTVGTTIKTDGLESDPYNILTVLNMHADQAHPSILPPSPRIFSKRRKLRIRHSCGATRVIRGRRCQCWARERLVNMPVQTVPPMYRI